MRKPVDLSNFSFQCGKLGRVMTLNVVPVCAGDSISINSVGVYKLAPLRRGLTVDPRVDVVTFYVPHRHIYGQQWIDFIQTGSLADSSAWSSVSIAKLAQVHAIPWLQASANPLWLVKGYANIWNRYFRPPRAGISERDETYPWSAEDDIYGWTGAVLPTIWNTGHDAATYPSNKTVPVTTGASPDFSLTDLAVKAAQWETNLQRNWKAHYYNDLMRELGGYATVDADQRPELCAQTTKYLSGFEVYGTTSNNLGVPAGKVENFIEHRMPRKLMPEHGALWTVAIVRVPPVHQEEVHWLSKKPNPSYAEITGDPTEVERREPIDLEQQDVFNGSGSNALGKIPYGQWLRYQPNIVNERYWDDNKSPKNFPFYKKRPANLSEAVFLDGEESWGKVFQGDGLVHWQASVKNNVECYRVTGAAGDSVFAGANVGEPK